MKINKSDQAKVLIKYPRNKLARYGFQRLGRILTKILTNTDIYGMENYPKEGRLIVVGNHTGVMETILMTSYAPRPIEYMGSVDIPHEPQLAFFMNIYKFIPIFRGKVSPSSMKAGLDVLNQEGVIGIFPEGGIWEPAIHKAQSGVAWLSYHGKSPILPIGFSATAGKLEEALALKRPYLKMHVGKLIPPVKILLNHPKKYQFQQASQEIMKAVRALLPKENLSKHEKVENEKFEFYVTIFDSDNNLIQIPQELELTNGAALSKILYRSTLINNFRDNLHLNITPLKNLNLKPSAQEISDSTGSILNYIKFENPYYFTYRY